MKKIAGMILGLCATILTSGQTINKEILIEVSKIYKNFMFTNEPTKDALNNLRTNSPEDLKATTEFIIQTITSDNKLLTPAFLSRPDDKTLKQIYIIFALYVNTMAENPINNDKLMDSLIKWEIPAYELVDNYYGMISTAVGNKNKPFNLSKVDFKLNDYHLKDDTEKGILFLRFMSDCNAQIWGYMNIVKPANTKKAYSEIKNFPKFNSQPYYQFGDFSFPDFKMKIADQGVQSYKSYYLNKYYEELIYHLVCLNKEGGSEKEKNDLLLGSILRANNLYKYTKYKETLESIFKEQKKD